MLTVKDAVFERVFTREGLPVLALSLRYPVISGMKPRAANRVNAFYVHLIKILTRRAEKNLLPAASAELARRLSLGRPFYEHRLRMTYLANVPKSAAGAEAAPALTVIRTLYLRAGGEEGSEHIFSDAWDQNGWLCP